MTCLWAIEDAAGRTTYCKMPEIETPKLFRHSSLSLGKRRPQTPTRIKSIIATLTMKSVHVIVQNTPFERRKESFLRDNEGWCSSYSVATATTELSSSISSSIADHSDYSGGKNDTRGRKACFDVDEYNNVRKEIFEYPGVEDEDKRAVYWHQEEVSRRRRARDAMVQEDNERRTHFIACVEELFNVPMKKRLIKKSTHSQSDSSVMKYISPVSREEAIQGLSSSDFRGYEHHCVRVIVGLRRR